MTKLNHLRKPIFLTILFIFLISEEWPLFAQINFTQLKSHNYIYSKTILNLTAGGSDLQESVQFFDFLGRPKQSITYKGSPLLKDIIQPFEYDAFGREANKYLPYTSSAANGLYRPAWKTEQATFYITTLGYGTSDGNRGFSQTVFDNSPENRVMKQGSPGTAWKIVTQDIARGSTEHIMSYQNSANTSSDVIYYWTISGTTSITFTRKSYVGNSLYKAIVTDENNNSSTEYKDIQGNIILKVDAIGGKTHYIYDDYGLLRLVMPPLATPTLSALSSFNTGNTTYIELCYYYEYDNRNRMIKKKMPGYFALYELTYDNLDRLIKTTDPNGIISYTDYDELSRPVETGFYESGVKTWQTRTIYDKYNLDIDYRTNFPYQNVYYPSYETGVKGKVTVSKTKVISPETDMKPELVSVTYYDKYGRVIQVISENHKNGRDRISHKYKYINSDLISETKHEHGINGTAYNQIVIEKYNYDKNGRLISNTHKIGTGYEFNMATKNYDEAGRLKGNAIGNKANEYNYNIRGWITAVNNLVVCSPDNIFGYELTYTYNGNITKCNWSNGASCFVKSYSYTYDQLNRMTHSAYSEIDHTYPLPGSIGKYNETITYDANGNILTALRYGVVNDGTGLVGKIDDLNYVYFNSGKSNRLYAVGDKEPTFMGRGDFNEFISKGSSTVEYSYDANGNLRYDKNKGIWISYNYLNLPYIIKNESGPELLRFIYNAGGKKVRQVTTMSATVKNTNDYIGPFVYKNGVLDYIITSDGRAVYQNGTFYCHEYHLKDHLGNVRLVFNTNGTSQNILQTYDYYPFGMVMGGDKSKTYSNKYRYNGKEIVLTERSDYPTDLSWLDYGKRFYDPQLGRFTCIDPLAEKYNWVTPYNYAENNPIANIDLWGLQAVSANFAMLFRLAKVAVNTRFNSAMTQMRSGGNNIIHNNKVTDAIPNTVRSQIPSSTQDRINTVGRANDIKNLKEGSTKVLSESTKLTGDIIETTGTAIQGLGYLAAPATEGASLSLVPIGMTIEKAGSGLNTLGLVIEGDYGKAVANATTDFVFGKVTKGIDNLSSSMSTPLTKTEDAILKATTKTGEEITDFGINIVDEKLEDEKKKSQ